MFSCRQQRLWSDYSDAQADLSLRCVHMSEGTFSHAAAKIMFSESACSVQYQKRGLTLLLLNTPCPVLVNSADLKKPTDLDLHCLS